MFAKASGLLRSAFRVGLNFFFGSLGPALSAAAGAGDAAEAADLLLPAKIGSGKRNMVTSQPQNVLVKRRIGRIGCHCGSCKTLGKLRPKLLVSFDKLFQC